MNTFSEPSVDMDRNNNVSEPKGSAQLINQPALKHKEIDNIEYIPIPNIIKKEMLQEENGLFWRTWLNVLEKNYKAREKHKKYYEVIMKENGLAINDPLPDEALMVKLLKFDSFMFGKFAYRWNVDEDTEIKYINADGAWNMAQFMEDNISDIDTSNIENLKAELKTLKDNLIEVLGYNPSIV